MASNIYKGVERQPINIPLRDIVNEDGEVEVHQEVQAHGYFDIRFKKNILQLTAGSFIGQIPLNSKVIIDVTPKVPFGNLVAFIGKSQKNIEILDFYRREYSSHHTLPDNIFEFLCKTLLIELRTLVKEGVYREYLKFNETTSFPKGDMNFAVTVGRLWSKGQVHRINVSYFNPTTDISHNRLIKYTLWYCLNHTKKIGVVDRNIIRELTEYYSMFDPVKLDRTRNFITPVQLSLYAGKIPVIRNYYVSLEKICLTIIQNVGLDLMPQGIDIETSSFIINLADIFEGYVFNLSRQMAENVDDSIRVLDGNTEGKRPFFNDTERFEAKPDIVFENETDVLLLIDAKYKTKIDESDRYQIISHALSYGAKAAIIVALGTTEKSGLEFQGTIGTETKIKIYVYWFDVENELLEKTESEFQSKIGSVLLSSIQDNI